MPTKWGLSYAPVGNTFVVNFDTGEVFSLVAPKKKGDQKKKKTSASEIPAAIKEIKLPKAIKDERNLFVDQLSADNEIWTEMGGPSGSLLYRVHAKGIRVFRVPVIDIPKVETSVEEEAATDLTLAGLDKQRRDRALAIVELAKTDPDKFYPMRVADAQIAAVSSVTRYFARWQVERVRQEN